MPLQNYATKNIRMSKERESNAELSKTTLYFSEIFPVEYWSLCLLLMTLAYCAGYTVFIGLFLLHSHFKSQYKNIEIVAKNEAAPPEYCNEHLIWFFLYKNYMQPRLEQGSNRSYMCVYKDSSHKYENYDIIYSPTCHFKPLWISFLYILKHFLSIQGKSKRSKKKRKKT